MARRSRKAGVWLALIAAGPLLVLGLGAFARRVAAAEPEVGVEWVQSSAGPVALALEPAGPAASAGVRPGDVLVEIDGRVVADALEASELAWSRGDHAPVRVALRRGGERVELTITPRWHPRPEPYLYLSIVGLAFWASGVFIAVKWPLIRGSSVYALFALCMFAHLILSHTGRADAVDRWIYWADQIAGVLAPALLLHLALVLSRGVVRRRRLVAGLAYAAAAVVALVAAWVWPDAGGATYRFDDPVLIVEARERLDPLLLSVFWLLALAVLVRSYNRSASIQHRSQMRWLLWGLAVGFGPFVFLYAGPWALGATELPGWTGFLAVAPTIVVPGACTAALARYRLHDLDLILLRGIAEVSAVFAAAAILSAAIYVLREGLAEWFPLSLRATRYIGFLVAALCYPQMRTWSRAVVERAFYRKRYSYRATLLDWARELNADMDLSSLLRRLRRRVRDTLGIAHAEVLLRIGSDRFDSIDETDGVRPLRLEASLIERLERHSYVDFDAGSLVELPWASYLFSMRVKGEMRAVLAIAERQGPEEPLTTEDCALLGTLSAHAATAIEAARLFQETRRRADEVELLHSRQQKILESSAVGLLLLDGDGRIEAWNRALEEIYGLERGRALGHRLGEVFPLHVVRRLERETGSRASGEETRIFRLGLINHRGDRILVNISISPVGGEGQADGARVVTFDDVTERVKLEDQVLRQERLASLGLLAAGVAHEINTPLTGISSYTQMLLDEFPKGDRRGKVLHKIEQQTHRAAGITRSLLNLARPERTAPEALDMNQVVGEVLQLFEPQVRRSGIHVRTALADDLPAISGNRGKLQQVILNLLINARDALEDSGNITVVSFAREGNAVIEVTDDGDGIAEEDLPRIFDPFFTTKRRGKGTGLGLSISYGIVQEHNGEIHVETTLGQYSRFRVELPALGSAKALA